MVKHFTGKGRNLASHHYRFRCRKNPTQIDRKEKKSAEPLKQKYSPFARPISKHK